LIEEVEYVRADLAPPAPEGWKIVPQKVTNGMIEAANATPSGIAGSPPHWQWVWDAMLAASPAAPSQPVEAGEVFDTDFLCVDSFAEAMKQKLLAARLKGRSGWQDCDPEDLSRMLREHVEKGDPRDVANFCMFLWHLNQPIAAQPAKPIVAWYIDRLDQACTRKDVADEHAAKGAKITPLVTAPSAVVLDGERAALPRYAEWLHLRTHGEWSDGVPVWSRDHTGRMNDFTAATAVIEELARAASPQPAINDGQRSNDALFARVTHWVNAHGIPFEAQNELFRLLAASTTWEALFDRVALELNCLPSSSVEVNDHVFQAIETLRAASPQATDQRCYAPGCHQWDGTDSCTCQKATATQPAQTAQPEPVAEVTNYRDVDGDLRAGVMFRGKSPPPGTQLFTRPQQTEQVLADDARDATRYRHLRDCNSGSLVIVHIAGMGDDEQIVLTEADADAAIDAALTAVQLASGADHD
jgi:hypothetical protein